MSVVPVTPHKIYLLAGAQVKVRNYILASLVGILH